MEQMKITEIAGKYIKESKNSITVVDEYGKTKGVVRNVRWYGGLSCRDKFEWHSKWRKDGCLPDMMDWARFFCWDVMDDEWYIIINRTNSHLEEIKARYENKFKIIVCNVLRTHDNQW